MILAVVLAGGLLALVVLILRAFGWSEEIRRRVVLCDPAAVFLTVSRSPPERSLQWRSSGNRLAGA